MIRKILNCAVAVSLSALFNPSYGQSVSWSSYGNYLLWVSDPNAVVHIGPIMDDNGSAGAARLIVDGDEAIVNGNLSFNVGFDDDPMMERKIIGNATTESLTLYGKTSVTDGPAIRLWGPDNQNTDASEGITFSTPNCGNSGGRSAFQFTVTQAAGCSSPSSGLLMNITREGQVIAGGFTGSTVNATSSLKVNTLGNGTGNQLVFAQSDGTLAAQAVPTLSIAGNALSMKNGSSINSTVNLPVATLSLIGNSLAITNGTSGNAVTLPSGSDNLGNHTATQDLNMAGKNIKSVNNIVFTGGVTLSGGTFPYFNSAIGVGTQAITSYALTVGGAGFFNGNVTANNITNTSDQRFKENIKPVESITDRLFKVQPYQYNFIKNFPGKNFDDKKHFGFIAQEVREVFPELVSEIDPEKHLGVNYIEFIPLLLQSYKEEHQKVTDLESRIAALENKINSLTNTAAGATAVDGPQAGAEHSYLNQNIPNPFTSETRISFFIAEKYASAFIGIYDMNGREMKKLPVTNGMSGVVVTAGDLAAGMYMYSLVIDGKLFDTKKMVLTGN